MTYEKILSDLAQDILIIADSQGKVKYKNKTAEKFLPQNNKAIASNKLFMHYISESLREKKEQHFQIIYQSKYYQVQIFPMEEDVAISMQDITENQSLKHTLSEMVQRLNFASRMAKIGYWELDLAAKTISWSSEMFRIFGIENKNISNKKNIIQEQMCKEDLPRYKDNLRKIMRTGQPEEGVVRILRPDGKMVYCRYMADYINNDYNRKIMGTFQDLTDMLEIQQALVAAKNAAERLNIEKSYFLAQASHDLQQPVSAMNLFINNLLNADLSGKQQFLVGKIYDSAQSLHHLLKNLLNISNLELRGEKANKQEFELYDVLVRIKKEIEYKLESQNINLKIVNCHQKINSDEFLVERILRNFISNALKYTKNKIIIVCKKNKNNIKIMVMDNGIGVSEEEISLIFNPYYQSPKILDNQHNGSGLGLAIAKKTANILGAEVGVLSKPEHGSCFYVKIKN